MSIQSTLQRPITVQTHFSKTCETFCALLLGPPDTSMEPLGDQFSLEGSKRFNITDDDNFVISPRRMKLMFSEISKQFGSDTVRYDVDWDHRIVTPESDIELFLNTKAIETPELFHVIIFGFTDANTYMTQNESYINLCQS